MVQMLRGRYVSTSYPLILLKNATRMVRVELCIVVSGRGKGGMIILARRLDFASFVNFSCCFRDKLFILRKL